MPGASRGSPGRSDSNESRFNVREQFLAPEPAYARDAKEGRRAALSANSLAMQENTGKSAFVFRHNSFEITERHVSLMAASQRLNALTRVATAMKSTCSRKERYVDKVGEHADRDLR